MKFVCTQENLSKGIETVAHLSSRSVGLPILNNILLEVREGKLVLTTTNLEIGIKTEVRGKAESSGSFTVDAKVLVDYINVLPKGNVKLEMVKNQLSVTCENFHTKIRGQAADEFPIIPELQQQEGYQVSTDFLAHALSQTLFAVSLDEMRPEISGVLFKVHAKELTIAATDSYRLAEKVIDLLQGSGSKEVIIPLKTLQEVERIASKDDGVHIDFYFDENQVLFAIGSAHVVSRLIEGNYPNYAQIIPTSFSTRASLSSQELIQATRAAALFARSGINDVALSCVPSKKVIEIKTSNAQLGEQHTTLEGGVSGEQVTVVFNYKYLLDGLQSIDSEQVTVEVSSSSTPALLKSDTDARYVYMIMPIKQ